MKSFKHIKTKARLNPNERLITEPPDPEMQAARAAYFRDLFKDIEASDRSSESKGADGS